MHPDPLSPAPLLPLRALTVTLEFTAGAHFSFFHQPAVHALVRGLLGSPDKFSAYLTLDAPETGRIDYAAGDGYRFAVYGLAGAQGLLATLINRLRELPESAPKTDALLPLRDNLRLVGLHDLFSGEPVRAVADLTLYHGDRLESEAALWGFAPLVRLRWLSPVRLLREKERRSHAKGELRYCREAGDLDAGLLFRRLYDTYAGLLRERGGEAPPRGEPPLTGTPPATLFWLDGDYRDGQGKTNPIGGMSGLIELGAAQRLEAPWWRLLVLGQYLGIGQRRAFGLGRYRLEAADGTTTAPEAEPCRSVLARAAALENLDQAYRVMRDNQREKLPPEEREAAEEREWWNTWYPDPPDPAAEERLADRLERLGHKLRDAAPEAAALNGVVFTEPDGDLRALAVPPFWERVAQRAVTQQITPALDQLMYHSSYHRSYGYRRGRSRQAAGAEIRRAWKEGYRWVYEADIDDFFDNVQWPLLELRLRSLYRDDPVVALLLAWAAAPVEYQGFRVARARGLPQGSPVSPVLANLFLDDFDSDLQSAGFRLVRFADDFVVLCKEKARAEAAGAAVRRSLAELGLELNETKSGTVSFEQGFRYLGYLFLNDMVLDSGRQGATGDPSEPGPLHTGGDPLGTLSGMLEQVPPNSWLARLGRREGVELSRLDEKKPATPRPLPQQGPARLGERGDDGTLLIVTGKSARLGTRQGRLTVTRDDETESENPWSGLGAVLLIGGHHITTPALRAALAHSVPVHLASGGGSYQGSVWNATAGAEGSGLWLEQQALFADQQAALHASRQVVMARIRHLREVLRQREPSGFPDVRRRLGDALAAVGTAPDSAALNGIEGNATRAYFGALALLIPEAYGFSGRNRRPPRDPFNALLSLGYTLLYSHVETLLRVDGLYPWNGFYHRSHGRHAALASDLMEPFRHLVERTALAAVTRGLLKPEDFRDAGEKGCRLTAPALRKYLAMLWERFDQPLTAVGDAEPYPVLQQIHRQNRRLVGWIRGGPEFKAWVAR